jgi:plastocyanin
MKKFAFLIVISIMVFSLLAACGGTSTPANLSANRVDTVGAAFSPTVITIKKGATITFIDDANNGALHILVIGQNAQQETETGAPDFGGLAGVRIDVGDTWTTPPWNTVGTYHVACTVHPAMNLTVIVTA